MKTETDKITSPRKRKTPAAKPPEWTEEQQQQIAALAYHHFLARGGRHGYHMEDWLRAEAEVAAMVAPPKPQRAARAKA